MQSGVDNLDRVVTVETSVLEMGTDLKVEAAAYSAAVESADSDVTDNTYRLQALRLRRGAS